MGLPRRGKNMNAEELKKILYEAFKEYRKDASGAFTTYAYKNVPDIIDSANIVDVDELLRIVKCLAKERQYTNEEWLFIINDIVNRLPYYESYNENMKPDCKKYFGIKEENV